MDSEEIEKRGKNSNSRSSSSFISRFVCCRSDGDYPTVDRFDGDGNIDMESGCAGEDYRPTHLIIMVNGIIGSAQNWKFGAKQFLKKYPRDIIVHCSECNSSMLTFDGVDVMGRRLADEVISVIKRYPDLQKISFIGHSLGGLIARYAIAKLYGQVITTTSPQDCGSKESDDPPTIENCKGKIGGLEPVNFITVATPHLGTKGHKQIPVFCGLYTFEKVASNISWCLGRSGKHLFLTDGKNGKPPLLLEMVKDNDDLPFMSALQSFKRRVAYANTRFDHLVGWSTSSLRRRNELPKLRHLQKNEKYPHVVNMEMAKSADPLQEIIPLEEKTVDKEEAMLRSLTKLSWERVDVSFKGSTQRFFAHNTIQVKTYCLNSDGADVIQHMVDNFVL